MQAFISGIVPLSTTEWFGKLSAVIFFGGCDFRCRYCYNPEMLESRQEFLTDLKVITSEIKKHEDMIESVIFSGGEPCLQRMALITLAKHFKSKELKVGIDTNGSKPNVIRELLSLELLDFISLDIKSPFSNDVFSRVTNSKTFFTKTEEIMDGIKETINVLRKYHENVELEIKTVIVPSLVYKKEDLLEIARLIDGLNCIWVLQQFENEKELVDKNMENIQPASEKFLENLKEFCLKEYPGLRVKIR
ncbi:MAG: anaerobic ribonucleoside-triphosphate reductase activating protein [Candidatus Woesearchaeota archaeon]|jgi:pyruvate formate lyase activating enzyme|nr:anaerobic ribonucleoside-triphosphate reductase activating protein [Candidatus Woesearchaeota archaeon]MDP7506077.1 anaerobic ribonucleoside-triphosphate reductase activating protein [Candidatus Woesearchaeota archaeon]|tara:strand:- start:4851 stop:5594 length:744 start_codon:yes stop_codon:yes gene_type:complete